jgi:hypothetical protein
MVDDGPSETAWVGRATPRPTPPQPVDPYWPPVAPASSVPYGRPGVPPHAVPPGYILVAAPPRRRRGGMRAVLLVAGIFAACCAGGATLALLSSAAFNGTGTFGSAPPGLNTPVRDGRLEFTVTSVSCGHESVGTLITRDAQGQFCIVDLSVRNIGTSDQLLLDSAQVAIGTDGAEYDADSQAGVIASNNISTWINLVKPGSTVTGKIVYDLPDGTSISKLELHDSAFSGGTTVTL